MPTTLNLRASVIAGLCVASALTSSKAAGVTGMSNLSALLQVPAGGSTPAIGFVISGTTTTLLVRAVGPSLASFGIKNTVAMPQLHFFNAAGTELYTSMAAVVIQNWPQVFQSVGAFPLTASGDDYREIGPVPGAYTISVTDGANKGGTVLLEVYPNPLAASGASGVTRGP